MEYHTGEILSHLPSSMTITCALVLLSLIIFSAVISGSLTAMSLFTQFDIDLLRKRGSKTYNCIANLAGERNVIFRRSSVVVSFVVNVATAIAASLLIDATISFGGLYIVEYSFKVVTISFVILFLSYFVPKKIALGCHLRFVQLSLPVIEFVIFISKPFLWLLGTPKESMSMSEKVGGRGEDNKKSILSGIMRFGATEVSAIMKHRTDVVALEIDCDFEHVKRVITDSGFSRIPVYGEDMDDIKGVLYVKDLLLYIERESFEWSELLRRPLFIPANKKISDLLEEFQARHIHFSIVVDEYGSTLGVVSLEDILEEIVGEISDESDADEKLYRKIDDNRYIFEGKTHIADFLRIMGRGEDLFDTVSGEAETVAGLMLEVNSDFLKVGDELTISGFSFRVLEIDGRRISKIKVVVI